MTSIQEILGRKYIHPFPARMAPTIALGALSTNDKNLHVLDPMTGSGTVLAVAQSQKHQAIGFDSDPLAVLLAKVWTTPTDRNAVVKKSEEILKRAQKIHDNLPLRDAYPKNADKETKKFVRYWFDARSRRQLTALVFAISGVHDQKMKDVLWCVFSRLIITKQAGASRAMDLSHSRPHRVFEVAPVMPFDKFIHAAKVVARNCLSVSDGNNMPASQVRIGDARHLPLESSSIDLVITSPPYLNAIDYLRCSKFSLVWMDYQINNVRNIRSNIIGAEVTYPPGLETPEIEKALNKMGEISNLSNRYKSIIRRYAHDIHDVLKETYRVLRPGSLAVFVIGNSTIRGTFINNANGLKWLAENVGLKCIESNTRDLPQNSRYLPPPSFESSGASLQSRMRTETVMTFNAV